MVVKGNMAKVSVTLPKELTLEIKSLVSRGEVSSFFAEALEHYLVYRRQKAAIAKGFGVWKDKDYPDLTTPEDSIQYVHDIRERDVKRLERQVVPGAK